MYTDKDGKQQVSSLELNAEMIKFSPFGNPDRPAQDQTAGQSQSFSTSKFISEPCKGFFFANSPAPVSGL